LLAGAFTAAIAALADRVDAQDPLLAFAGAVKVGPGSGEIFLVDIDRDGHPDLVSKHLLQGSMAVHLGDGNGRFAPRTGGRQELGYEPGAALLADVNRDGIVDLIVARKDPVHEYVEVLAGDGSGGFRPAGAPVTTNASFAYYKPWLAVADVDQDGHADIVTANGRRNRIELLRGDGHAGFGLVSAIVLAAGYDRYTSAVADIDGDGRPDVITALSGADGRAAFAWQRGDSQGGFRDGTASMPAVLPHPRLLAVADVDGDRRVDLMLGHGDIGRLSILLNAGQGRFSHAPGSPYEIVHEAFDAAVADVNRDGAPDIVAATVGSVTVLLGNGRTFAEATGSPFVAGPGAYHVAIDDIDHDGKLDVAASSFEGDTVTILRGR
jgi:hypothetical protein